MRWARWLVRGMSLHAAPLTPAVPPYLPSSQVAAFREVLRQMNAQPAPQPAASGTLPSVPEPCEPAAPPALPLASSAGVSLPSASQPTTEGISPGRTPGASTGPSPAASHGHLPHAAGAAGSSASLAGSTSSAGTSGSSNPGAAEAAGAAAVGPGVAAAAQHHHHAELLPHSNLVEVRLQPFELVYLLDSAAAAASSTAHVASNGSSSPAEPAAAAAAAAAALCVACSSVAVRLLQHGQDMSVTADLEQPLLTMLFPGHAEPAQQAAAWALPAWLCLARQLAAHAVQLSYTVRANGSMETGIDMRGVAMHGQPGQVRGAIGRVGLTLLPCSRSLQHGAHHVGCGILCAACRPHTADMQ